MARIDAFFRLMVDEEASDLHMTTGSPPQLRVRGDLVPIEYAKLTSREIVDLVIDVLTEDDARQFEESGDLDFAYEVTGTGRFRGNIFRQRAGASAVFRLIPDKVATLEELGLPATLKRFAMLNQGLVVVTGPTGAGKSTTLAAILDHALKERSGHVVTLEDPVEYWHQHQKSIINHRQVGKDTEDYATGLRSALRQDPDIVLLGELRDLETMQLALQAANTGHLVLTTLHTPNAAQTVDRIVDVFPADVQAQVRISLSECLKAVVSQQLFRRTDVDGRVAALEILIGTPAVSNLIREEKTYQLDNLIQTGNRIGMRLLDDSIQELLDGGMIRAAEAFEKSIDKARFAKRVPNPEEIHGFELEPVRT